MVACAFGRKKGAARRETSESRGVSGFGIAWLAYAARVAIEGTCQAGLVGRMHEPAPDEPESVDTTADLIAGWLGGAGESLALTLGCAPGAGTLTTGNLSPLQSASSSGILSR